MICFQKPCDLPFPLPPNYIISTPNLLSSIIFITLSSFCELLSWWSLRPFVAHSTIQHYYCRSRKCENLPMAKRVAAFYSSALQSEIFVHEIESSPKLLYKNVSNRSTNQNLGSSSSSAIQTRPAPTHHQGNGAFSIIGARPLQLTHHSHHYYYYYITRSTGERARAHMQACVCVAVPLLLPAIDRLPPSWGYQGALPTASQSRP